MPLCRRMLSMFTRAVPVSIMCWDISTVPGLWAAEGRGVECQMCRSAGECSACSLEQFLSLSCAGISLQYLGSGLLRGEVWSASCAALQANAQHVRQSSFCLGIHHKGLLTLWTHASLQQTMLVALHHHFLCQHTCTEK